MTVTTVSPGARTALPPGPRWPSPLVAAAAVFGQPHFGRWVQRRYGDRATLDFGRFGTVVTLTDPDDIKAVFRGDAATFHAGEANAPVLATVLGPTSVLVTDDEVHRR